MNLVKKFFRNINRLRHSHGFGVHSAYAFRFVENVIRPKCYGYYAYDILDADPSLTPRIAAKAKWLVRIAVFLETKRFVILQPPCPDSFHSSLMAASKAMKMSKTEISNPASYIPKPGDFVIVSGSRFIPSSNHGIDKFFEAGIPLLAIAPDKVLRQAMNAQRPYGLLLGDTSKMLLIPRKEMAYTAYNIKF